MFKAAPPAEANSARRITQLSLNIQTAIKI